VGTAPPAPALSTAAPAHVPSPPRATAAAPAAPRTAAPAAPRPAAAAPAPVVRAGVSTFDTILAIAAAIIVVAAAASTGFLLTLFKPLGG